MHSKFAMIQMYPFHIIYEQYHTSGSALGYYITFLKAHCIMCSRV